ncbi:conserved exported hypothetical protein [Nostocoides japonicum T1-X7]|uniref:Secreted protein n=1 Tax=Nostocoides japonicum T1-X7 TaxID=1194083 RepID=A0A077LXE9_9MICO|nr:DUF3048 domain-containing protein [Tetrasphaera japonica]CCH78583.1 conserved exported hypothetical protein [Tetrasphaera japonica T1-X7]
MDSIDRRALLLGALAAASAGTLAGCDRSAVRSAGPSVSITSPTTTSASPTTVADTRPRWPLTGRLVKDPAATHHAAVAVKVPDNKDEHPQVGIDAADIVFVELDGYRDASGYAGTRLVPLFHSRMPADVAPVRSIRPVDVPLLSPADAIIGNTGGAGWVLNYVRHYGAHLDGMLSYVNTVGTGSYSIDRARVRYLGGQAYYDRAVVCHPKVLARQTTLFRSGPPEAYFPFATGRTTPSTAAGRAARTLHVPWKQGDTYDMGYTYDRRTGRYLRSMPWGPHVLADGTRVSTDNVLVIRARQHYAKIYRGSGHDEPIHDIVDAKGTFAYAHGGRYVSGTWAKAAVTDRFTFRLADGSPLVMAPGQTFVELVRDTAHLRITG